MKATNMSLMSLKTAHVFPQEFSSFALLVKNLLQRQQA